MIEKFFSIRGSFRAYEMYTAEHLKLAIICILCVFAALFIFYKQDHRKVKENIRVCTLLMWILEIGKITFNLCAGNVKGLNSYIPFYFCSLPLYMGIFSSFGKGMFKKIGDIFLTVGGIIGGIVYVLCPSTTAGVYPAFHFITVRSFIHHGIMIYLGVLMIITNYVNLKLRDLKIYALTVSVACTIACILNTILGTNLMFMSKTNPGTAVDIVYNFSHELYPVLMTLIHAILPFFVVYGCTKLWKSAHAEDEEEVKIDLY